jgi:signal transduction histidine kinase
MTVAVSARLGAELPREHEVVLLRCAQEGLANARKHAAASSVELSLTVSDEGTLLRVADNGTGFDTASDTHGFGLAGMRERLALVGGSLEIASGPAGTTLEVTL